jgi:hypothetical protein
MPEKTAEHFTGPKFAHAARMMDTYFQRQSTNLSTSFVDNAVAGFLLKSRHSLRHGKNPLGKRTGAPTCLQSSKLLDGQSGLF